MAHYAFLNDDNIVVEVIAGRNEDDLPDGIESWETYYANVRGLTCKRTSYNTLNGVHYETELNDDGALVPSSDQTKAFRHNYASVGFVYLPDSDAFIPPRPDAELPMKFQIDEPNLTWVQVDTSLATDS